MQFTFARFRYHVSRCFLIFAIVAILLSPHAFAQVVEIPDPNLREAIRETLQLPAGQPITQQQMLRLETFNVEQAAITDLTGLEYATNLESLQAWFNPISDLTPLVNLTNLIYLDITECHIVDIAPLANLIRLQSLHISSNQIVDIGPLANLTQLQEISLQHNKIEDISSLANLIQLEALWLDRNRVHDITPLSNLTKLRRLGLTWNPILDYTPLDGLPLTVLKRTGFCELPPLPIEPRLQNRTFPSVVGAFAKPTDTQIIGLNHLSSIEQLALHDLTWRGPSYFGLTYTDTPQGWKLAGFVEKAQQIRDDLLALNPNMIFLVEVRVRDAWIGYYPEDFPYWLRDENGDIIKTPSGSFLITDFTQPGMQDIIVQQATAVAQCGLFDGIYFDWFHEHLDVLPNYYSLEEELRAKDDIFQRIRAAVPDNLLVLIGTNRARIPRKAWGTNGTFMETLRDKERGLSVGINDGPYTYRGLIEIEDTLLWAEENLREPQINCLEGWGIPDEPPDSPTNLRFMRLFTTMSLTCSDGYVLYGIDNTHQHIWYDFWDANLGRPIGPKAQRYQEDIEGLYIREFTNGWAVYNRSGQPQTITLPQDVTAVGNADLRSSTTHLLPDLDGEIYLTTKSFADVNRDGRVDILDLLQVGNNLGESTPDPNGDGVVNTLDLVFVAQQFSQ